MVFALSSIALVVSLVVPVVASGCGDRTHMHSVADVRAAFSRHGLKLSVVDRNRISTSLLPRVFVRALRETPTLGRPPPSPGYEVVVFTNRRWLRDLPRHERETRRALELGSSSRLSKFTTRRDNVFIVYPAGAPRCLPRLKHILDDI